MPQTHRPIKPIRLAKSGGFEGGPIWPLARSGPNRIAIGFAWRSPGAFHQDHFVFMKVLVADKISPKAVAWLRQQPGLEVIEAYGSAPAKLLELVKDVHAIAVRSETKITAEVMAAAPLL